MMISQLNELQKETFAQVKNVVCFRISTFLKPLIQFKENIKDCKLIDSSDDYIVKWLVGKFPFFSFRTFCWLISTPLVARWETWFKKTWHSIANTWPIWLISDSSKFWRWSSWEDASTREFSFLFLFYITQLISFNTFVWLIFSSQSLEWRRANRIDEIVEQWE